MKITKDCEKILKILNQLQHEGTIAPNQYDIIKKISLKKNTKLPLRKVLNELKNNGYISFLKTDDLIFNIQLTYKGLSYKEFRWLEFKEFIKQSIIVPIIISAITSFISFQINLWLTKYNNKTFTNSAVSETIINSKNTYNTK